MKNKQRPQQRTQQDKDTSISLQTIVTLPVIIAVVLIIEIALVVFMFPKFQVGHWRRMAESLYEKGNYAKSNIYWKKLDRKYPANAPVIKRGLGNSFFAMGNYEEARTCYEQALDDDTGMEGIRTKLGQIYFMKEEYEKAVENFAKALKENPKDEDAAFYLGKFHFEQENYRQAAVYFQALGYNGKYKKEIDLYTGQIADTYFSSDEE